MSTEISSDLFSSRDSFQDYLQNLFLQSTLAGDVVYSSDTGISGGVIFANRFVVASGKTLTITGEAIIICNSFENSGTIVGAYAAPTRKSIYPYSSNVPTAGASTAGSHGGGSGGGNYGSGGNGGNGGGAGAGGTTGFLNYLNAPEWWVFQLLRNPFASLLPAAMLPDLLGSVCSLNFQVPGHNATGTAGGGANGATGGSITVIARDAFVNPGTISCAGADGSGGHGAETDGGGGGGAGGNVAVYSPSYINNTGGTISARAGNGGTATTAGADGGGGGGGGGGGIWLIAPAIQQGTLTVAGGSGGGGAAGTDGILSIEQYPRFEFILE